MSPLTPRRSATLSAIVLAVTVLTVSCATPPPPQPAPKPVAGTDQSNGEYRGTATRYQADSRRCPHPGLVTLIVFADKFQYRWDHDTWLDATISPDGEVRAEGPGISLQGRLIGNRIEGDVTDGTCGFHFTVKKRGA